MVNKRLSELGDKFLILKWVLKDNLGIRIFPPSEERVVPIEAKVTAINEYESLSILNCCGCHFQSSSSILVIWIVFNIILYKVFYKMLLSSIFSTFSALLIKVEPNNIKITRNTILYTKCLEEI